MSKANPPASPASNRKAIETAFAGKQSFLRKISSQAQFILAFANLELDDKGKVIIVDLDKIEKESKVAGESFAAAVKEAYQIINDMHADLKKNGVVSGEIKVHKAQVRKDHGHKSSSYFRYSPKRFLGNMQHENLGGLEFDFRIMFAIKSLLINHEMNRILDQIGISKERYRVLQPKLSKSEDYAAYLRDNTVVIGDEIFFPRSEDLHIKPEVAVINQKRNAAAVADLTAQGFVGRATPFVTEGGNIITGKDKDGNDVMLIAVSNLFFDFKDEFIGANFTQSDGLEINFPAGEEGYANFCAHIKDWGQSLGYNTKIIHRQRDHDLWKPKQFHHGGYFALTPTSNVSELYHIDTFMGVAGNILLMPEEPIITEETRRSLIETFGEENIILLNAEERKTMMSNFIVFDDNIVFGTPKVSQRVIDELNKRGFNCVVSSFDLKLQQSDQIRCQTAEICGFDATKLRDSSRNSLDLY